LVVPPPNAPKPAVHVPPPVDVMLILDAVTAPVELVDPLAVTQSPTARLLAAAACISAYVVEDDNLTVTVVAWAEVGGVDAVDPGARPLNEKPLSTMSLALTEVTLPEANENPAATPLGRVPRGKVLFGTEPGGRVPLPTRRPRVQLPDEEGGLIVTVRAVMVPAD
jgi:hypothetical protein